MGAANFYTKNASRHFVVLTSYDENRWTCQECGEIHYDPTDKCETCESLDLLKSEVTVHPDNSDYRILKEELLEELEKVGYREEGSDHVASKGFFKSFGDTEVGFSLAVRIRSAYYDGATLDYDFLNYDGSEDEIQYIKSTEYEFENSDMSEGLKTIQRRNADKWISREIERAKEEVEKVFGIIAPTQLRTVGHFSSNLRTN